MYIVEDCLYQKLFLCLKRWSQANRSASDSCSQCELHLLGHRAVRAQGEAGLQSRHHADMSPRGGEWVSRIAAISKASSSTQDDYKTNLDQNTEVFISGYNFHFHRKVPYKER